jgi:hypothetical protein
LEGRGRGGDGVLASLFDLTHTPQLRDSGEEVGHLHPLSEATQLVHGPREQAGHLERGQHHLNMNVQGGPTLFPHDTPKPEAPVLLDRAARSLGVHEPQEAVVLAKLSG